MAVLWVIEPRREGESHLHTHRVENFDSHDNEISRSVKGGDIIDKLSDRKLFSRSTVFR